MNRLSTFKPYITGQNSSHLSLVSDVKRRREFISAAAEELRMYLEPYKGKYISRGELQEYYKKNFPKLRIYLEAPNDEGWNESRFNPSWSGFKDITIDISSAGFLEQGMDIFGIKRKKQQSKNQDYYVNRTFVENFVHENTHVMQQYLKPTILISHRGLTENAGSESSLFFTKMAAKDAYEHLYMPFLLISLLSTAVELCQVRKKCNKETVATVLKQCIRDMQEEKEAYKLGARERRKAFSIFGKQSSRSTKLDDMLARFNITALCFFGTKAKIFKPLYFYIIKQIRKENAKKILS